MWNGQTFTADVQAFTLQAKARLQAVFRQSIQEVCFRVVYTSPVLTGFLRASWQPGIGAPPPMPNDQGRAGVRVSYEDSGVQIPISATSSVLTLALANLKPGLPFYYVNNARYARRIENGFVGVDSLGRHVNQRGRFTVRDAVSQWHRIVGEQVALLGGAQGGAPR
jgi:hypothetical protein